MWRRGASSWFLTANIYFPGLSMFFQVSLNIRGDFHGLKMAEEEMRNFRLATSIFLSDVETYASMFQAIQTLLAIDDDAVLRIDDRRF